MESSPSQQHLTFLASQYKLDLGQMIPLKLSLAYNNTFVFVHKPYQHQIVHMTLNGDILLKIWTKQTREEFVMPDDHHLIFDSGYGNKENLLLQVLDLKNGQLTDLKYNSKLTNMFKMFHFRESKLTCIVETHQKEIWFKYFILESQKIKDKDMLSLRLVCEKKIKSEDVVKSSLHKIDDYSKILWRKSEHQEYYYFKNPKNSNKYGQCSLSQNILICQQFNLPSIAAQVIKISQPVSICWQLQSGQYLLGPQLCLIKEKYQYKDAKSKVLNPTIMRTITDFKVEQLKFYYRGKKDHIVVTGDKYKCYYLNNMFVLVNIDYDIKFNTCSQVYYINFQDKQIIAIDQWKTPGQAGHQEIDWDNERFIQTVYQQFQKYTLRIIDLNRSIRDVYMHMLLHVNQDFDDDLLQDTVELLY